MKRSAHLQYPQIDREISLLVGHLPLQWFYRWWYVLGQRRKDFLGYKSNRSCLRSTCLHSVTRLFSDRMLSSPVSLHANYFHFTALPMCTTNCSHFLDCESRHGYYYCNCQPGFSGPHCNMNIDECSSSPCVNGKCVDGVNRYDCICNKGYWGTNCDKEVKRESKGGNKCWIFLKVKHSKSESLLYWSLAVTKFVSSFKESGKEVVTLLLKRL